MRQLPQYGDADRAGGAVGGVEIDLRKVEDIQQIMGYGVLTTPAVAIDGKVVHAGGIPRREAIREWLATAASEVRSPGVPTRSSGAGDDGGDCCGVEAPGLVALDRGAGESASAGCASGCGTPREISIKAKTCCS